MATPAADPRRSITGVDALLGSEAFAPLLAERPRERVRSALVDLQAELRGGLAPGDSPPAWLADPGAWAARVAERMRAEEAPGLVPVINATGVVLHTNLGRAPLASAALRAVAEAAAGYANLEYDLAAGQRGSRYDHCRALLCRLTGAEDALVVNNNAAALVLALNTVAAGGRVAVSRGELVEIGDGFRIGEIAVRAGVGLAEVGATNRTRVEDYRAALAAGAAAVLKVHPSNFSMRGYTGSVAPTATASVAAEAGVPFVHDLGSGLLLDLAPWGLGGEPTAAEALAAGAVLVTLSGDKLLGGPQAGLVLGRRAWVEAMRRNPLCRALRVDKLTLAALEATLRLYLDPDRAREEIPALRMLTEPVAALRRRAAAVVERLRASGVRAGTSPGSSAVGGGAFPDASLPTELVLVEGGDAGALAARLRTGTPAVVGRVSEDRLCLDLRTVLPGQDAALVEAVLGAVHG